MFPLLTFPCLIHLEIFLVYYVRNGSSFIFFPHVVLHLFQCHFLAHHYSNCRSHFYCILNLYMQMVYIGFSILFHGLSVFSHVNIKCFNYRGFSAHFNYLEKLDPLFVLFQGFPGYSCLLFFQMNLIINLYST